MATTLAVKVNTMIISALEIPIDRIFFWTDSTAVLRYIRNNEARFHTLLAICLTIIHVGSECDQWKYVNFECNLADDTSRGNQSVRWHKSPEFLFHEDN